MRIAAWSDGHGILPVIEDNTDIMIIAGDVVPLNIQRDYEASVNWLKIEFFEYVKNLKCNKVILVPGNHDFVFMLLPFGEMEKLIELYELKDKLVYLEDKLYEYNNLKFYGCPWCTGPFGWAFSPCRTIPDISKKYTAIPKCDILITHQPPKVEKVGCSNPYQPYEREFGSDRLRNAIENKGIKLLFCGHIHTGTHNGVKYNDTIIYNVSLLDEDYESTYNVTYVEI